MSKKDFPELNKRQRVEYAKKVKSLRQSAGMTQQELAEAAGVSRPTVIALESGDQTPQSENVLKVLKVFGVDVETHRYSDETELWLSVMGALIEAIPAAHRAESVNKAIRLLSDGVTGKGIVSPIKQNVDKRTVDLSKYAKAASKNHDSEEPDTP